MLIRQRELAPTESFVLAFVQASLVPTLSSRSSLWPLVPLYLEQCPLKGGALILELVHRLPVESDYTATKLLDVCATYNLPKAAAAIATRRGQWWESKQKVAIALTWYLRANNVDGIHALCESIVQNPSQHGQLEAAAKVLSTEAPTFSPIVSFLVQYYNVTLVLRDLTHLQQTADDSSTNSSHPKLHVVQRDAARRLGDLCTQCNIPRHLWHSTWASIVPLVHLSPPVFSSHELFGLLEALQDHEISLDGSGTDDKSLVATLQHAIAVGLSQTMLVDV
ncbi:hypothetical protein DYB32_007443 [Aphanomyces invadans]|uniref:Nuclear pore complex protein Nup85 n=1 Tax=Aphanomyces invadans TaxID=157072 RepID=A0A418ANP0_9STRA|nr:hypothetical protein DYB32_007443 [Aphanomyces invadans]